MRFPDLKPDRMSVPQRIARAEMYERGRDAIAPFYDAALYSPEAAIRTHATLEFMRHGLRIPLPLRAIAILVAARKHGNEPAKDFAATDDIRTSGLEAHVIDALVTGEAPAKMSDDQALVYDFCSAVVLVGRVKTPLFERAAERFGKEICLEMVTLCGFVIYTTFLMNVTGKGLRG